MPTKVEKDAITGTETTGHEWDGIKELDTPMPRWWLYTFFASIVVAIIYMVLYPSVPWVGEAGYAKGVLGFSQRVELENSMAEARGAQAAYLEKLEAASLEDILNDPDLTNFALAGGRAAFANNCTPCHGAGGAGGVGYPVLADDDWLWGGALGDIYTTLQHGIHWPGDEDTRDGAMPAFGSDDLLETAQINDVAEYVLSLSGTGGDAAAAARGSEVFAENCTACHGDGGEGGRDFGAPRLNDAIWLYGGDKATVVKTITKGRRGAMPAWKGRLSDSTIKQLAIYVHSLGGGE